MNSLIGKLVMTGGGSYWLLLDEEKEVAIPVKFRDPEMGATTPLNVPIKLFAGLIEHGYLYVPMVEKDHWYDLLYGTPGLRDTRKHVLVAYKAPLDATDEQIASYLKIANGHALEIEAYAKCFAGQHWDVKAHGFVYRSNKYAGAPYFARREILEAYEADPIEGFYPNHTYSLGEHDDHYWGQATLGGSAGAGYICNGVLCPPDALTHEFLHSCGSLHAKRLKPDGTVQEYGEPAMMGTNKTDLGLNASNYLTLNLDSDKKVVRVTENAAVLICPLELQPEAVHEEEQQIALIPGKPDLLLSTRKIKGHPYPANDKEPRLYVHQHTPESSVIVASLKEGERYFAESGPEIVFIQAKEETLFVDIAIPNSHSPFDVPDFPEGFPPAPPSEPPTEAMSGLWWNPDQSHQGFDIRVKDGRIGFLWYTYDAQGKLRYYTASCGLDMAHEWCRVYTTTGGTFEHPEKSKRERIGNGQIYFISEDTAVFNFDTTEHGRGTIRLTRMVQSASWIDGWFYDPERDGEGFGVVTWDDTERLIYWYTYTDETNKGEQEWYVISEGKILRTSGGKFMRLTDSKLVKEGEAVCTFNEGGLSVKFQLNGKTGIRKCVRLF